MGAATTTSGEERPGARIARPVTLVISIEHRTTQTSPARGHPRADDRGGVPNGTQDEPLGDRLRLLQAPLRRDQRAPYDSSSWV